MKISDPPHGEQTANKWRITGGCRQYWADKLSPASVCVWERGIHLQQCWLHTNTCSVCVCVCQLRPFHRTQGDVFVMDPVCWNGTVPDTTYPTERERERGGEGWTSAGFQFIKRCCWCFRLQIRATATINLTQPFHHGERQTTIIAVFSPRLSHNTAKYPHISPIYYCSWNSILSVCHTVHNATFDMHS